MTQRMLVAAALAACVRALTLQAISLFSADSRLPRSVMVICNFFFSTGCVINSALAACRRVRKYQPPRPMLPAVSRAKTTSSPLRRRLQWRALGRRLGTGLGELFEAWLLFGGTAGWGCVSGRLGVVVVVGGFVGAG